MTLVAKTIVNNQSWIILEGSTKIGNLYAIENGYSLIIGKSQFEFSNKEKIQDFVKIEFERNYTTTNITKDVCGNFPNSGSVHNEMMDIKRKLHIYTKSKKSKCYYVSGWFKIKIDNEWIVTFCPKYIFIQRYEYKGPFTTETEAVNQLEL
jgi:hypothetical protein